MQENRYRPTSRAALILSPDPLAGALIGAAVELSGVSPTYCGASETPRDALRRIRPVFVLIDCDDASADDEAFIGPALMTSARVILFGATRSTHRLRAVAERFQLTMVELPRDIEELTRLFPPQAQVPEQVRR